jgi:hypothetical protein
VRIFAGVGTCVNLVSSSVLFVGLRGGGGELLVSAFADKESEVGER